MFDPVRGYPSVVPYLRYRDPVPAVRWLTTVLGAREAVRMTLPDGRVGHVELTLGNAVITVGLALGDAALPTGMSRRTLRAMTLAFVDDVDQTLERAVSAGGTVVDPATDQPWGLRQAIVADPEGHLWEVSTHLRDVPVAAWGAIGIAPLPG